MSHPVIWFEVIGQDAGKLKSFYSDLFGWQIEEGPGGYGMVAPEGRDGLMGGIGSDPSGGAGHVTWYAQADDLEATLEKAESLGGRTIMPPTSPMEGTTIALLADPEGHIVGIVKPGPPPEG